MKRVEKTDTISPEDINPYKPILVYKSGNYFCIHIESNSQFLLTNLGNPTDSSTISRYGGTFITFLDYLLSNNYSIYQFEGIREMIEKLAKVYGVHYSQAETEQSSTLED